MTIPRIIGLDLGIRITGLTDWDGKTFALRPRGKGYERHASLLTLLTDYLENTDLVVVEGYSLNSPYPKTLIAVGELGGVARALIAHRRIPFVDVPPATLKQFATGKGNATKFAMGIAAKTAGMAFVDERTDDEVDSWWLWRMARIVYGESLRRIGAGDGALNEARIKALGAVDWPRLSP